MGRAQLSKHRKKGSMFMRMSEWFMAGEPKILFCVKLRAMFLFLSNFTAVQKRGKMGEVERNATECIGF